MAEIEEQVLHYKRYLERHMNKTPNNDKIVKIFRKLTKLGLSLDNLQNTGIGKAVNSYRKHDGEVGQRARDLVNMWKEMVSREASPAPPSLHSETIHNTSVPLIHSETVSETSCDSHSRAPKCVPYMDEILAQRASSVSPVAAQSTHSKDSERRHKEHKKPSSDRSSSQDESKHKSSDSNHVKRSEFDSHLETKEKVKDHSVESKSKSKDHSKHDHSHSKHSSKHGTSRVDGHHKEKERDAHRSKSENQHEHDSSRHKKDKHASHSSHHRNNEPSSELRAEKSSKSSKESVEKPQNSHADMQGKTESTSTGAKFHDTSPVSANEDKDERNSMEEEDDHQGMSFEEFLNYDAAKIKSKKVKKSSNHQAKKEGTPKPESKSDQKGDKDKKSREKSHKHSSSLHRSRKHKDSSKRSSHKESSHHVSQEKNVKEKTSDDSRKRKADKAELFVPMPEKPNKQVKLSTDDILATIDGISDTYRPLPRPIFHEESVPTFKESDIGSKNFARTAIYSGKKNTSFLTSVPTLFNSCLLVLKENVDALDYVGGVPYDILKPVLEVCTPAQLYKLEDVNPHFLGETDELWMKHCQKDFRNAKPDEFESWRELYLKKQDEREDKLKNLTASISKGITNSKKAERTTKLAYVDVQAKAPRSVRRQQQKHGTAGPQKLDPLAKLSSHGSQNGPKVPIVRGIPGPSSSSGRAKSSQKAVKPMAPMMAKTIRSLKSMRYK